ncbi:hypothetical protein [Gracilibacillus kekensis]|uniref:Uncharacterized protein n=1 Tax=Gracilibacillus kekensis TaxID=1027249 RepID=A0A1M7MKX7_9BACI|nr:hypothetical protein [Gracilibacillus kekensis]SHM91554.1 hypothetical protein SAMN05216179_1262 [Gracilibacillus kekensis]
MKVKYFHISYFVALIVLSFMSFFIIFGVGFVGNINLFILVIPFVLSTLWLSDYTWRFLSLKSDTDKIQLIHPAKNWTFTILFLSGILIIYSLFLTTLIPAPINDAPSWMFLGTPSVLLLMWYGLLYRYTKNKMDKIQLILGSFLLIVSLVYTYQICEFYAMQFFL